jgi:hypothetical protein
VDFVAGVQLPLFAPILFLSPPPTPSTRSFELWYYIFTRRVALHYIYFPRSSLSNLGYQVAVMNSSLQGSSAVRGSPLRLLLYSLIRTVLLI